MYRNTLNIPRVNTGILILTFLTLTTLIHLSKTEKLSKCSEEENTRMITALRRSLVYIKNHDETKTLDIALAVMLVKGNLQWILNTFEETFAAENSFYTEITRLIQMSDDIFYDISTHLQNSTSTRDRKFSSLLTYNFRYILAEDLKRRSLKRHDFQFPHFTNCSSISAYFFDGSPHISDLCILELFDTKCNISRTCFFQEANDIESRGYKTSHRLLYLQLASKLQCAKHQPRTFRKSKYMKKNLCEKMLMEVSALNRQNIFLARDLFLENIALCGFEGYVEFWERRWIRMILDWQNNDGCFGFKYPERLIQKACNGFPDSNARTKRDDVVINGVCHTHITAVAISALAFLLRVSFRQSVIDCLN